MSRDAWNQIRLDRWPEWDALRQRTRDLFSAMIRAVEDDRDRPRKRRMSLVDVPTNGQQIQRVTAKMSAPVSNGMSLPVVPPAPTHNVLAAPAAQHRYEAGSTPDPASVFLGEAGVPGV